MWTIRSKKPPYWEKETLVTFKFVRLDAYGDESECIDRCLKQRGNVITPFKHVTDYDQRPYKPLQNMDLS